MFEFTWLIGIVILGAALFYATRQRRLRGAQRAMSEQAARENWGKEELH
jgi:hypothetical protein